MYAKFQNDVVDTSVVKCPDTIFLNTDVVFNPCDNAHSQLLHIRWTLCDKDNYILHEINLHIYTYRIFVMQLWRVAQKQIQSIKILTSKKWKKLWSKLKKIAPTHRRNIEYYMELDQSNMLDNCAAFADLCLHNHFILFVRWFCLTLHLFRWPIKFYSCHIHFVPLSHCPSNFSIT